MKRPNASRCAALALLSIAACAPPPTSSDAGPDSGDSAAMTADSAGDARAIDSATAAPDSSDASTMPVDSGTHAPDAEPTDSGVEPTDSGVAPMDSGVAPMDSGVPPVDSGVAPTDSGVPPMDSGVPPTDSGIAPSDSGVPPTDTGVITPYNTPLQNATADFSQSSYAVGEAINGITTGNDGWAITNGGTARTAVFETVSDTSAYAGGTDLVITLRHASTLPSPYNLGRFRIAVTSADRSMFADGLANGGNLGPSTIWSIATVVSAASTGTTTLAAQADRSILAAGANSFNTVYTVRVRTPLTRITGIRLETLTNASLPSNGPGRADDGNFILTELGVDAYAAPIPAVSPVAFGALPGAAAASFSQPSFDASEVIDGMIPSGAVNNGWAISNGGTTGAETAVFETAADTPSYGGVGTRLQFTMHHNFGTSHTLGRFRFLVTTANRSTFSDGLVNGGNLGSGIWSPVVVRAMTATAGTASFTILADGSVLTSAVGATATYQITAVSPLEGITGVRLEALPDATLPGAGPGNSTAGNFVLTELALAAGPQI